MAHFLSHKFLGICEETKQIKLELGETNGSHQVVLQICFTVPTEQGTQCVFNSIGMLTSDKGNFTRTR